MRVVTSGTGGALPRGIPVGEVSRLTEKGVEVRLYASDQGAYLVRVVDYSFPDPAQELSEPDEDEDLGESAALISTGPEAVDG